MFNLNDFGEYDIYLVRYNVSSTNLSSMTIAQYEQIEKEFIAIQVEGRATLDLVCVDTQEYQLVSDSSGNSMSTIEPIYYWSWVTTSSQCGWVTGNTNPINTIDGGGVGGDTSGSHSGGGTSSTSGSIYTGPVSLSPDLLLMKDFVMNFLDENQEACYAQQTEQAQNNIFVYLVENDFTNISKLFIKDCLDKINQDPNDVLTSITPFLIEKKIDDSELDPCTRAILNKLKQNNTIAKIISRFDSPDSDFSILMSQVPNLVNPNGQNVYAETEAITNLQFQIKLNSNYYNNSGSTHIGKVGTILHEIIHALIMSIYSNSNNTSLNGSTDFPDLWNYYVTNIQGQGTLTNELQHQWMMTYQNVIQDALVEYANTTNSNPPIGQTIQEFCYYLSWAGIYTGPGGIQVPDSTLPMSDKLKVLFQKQAEMTNSNAPNNTLPSNNLPCN